MFENAIKNYSENLQALREFVELTQPFLLKHSNKVIKSHSPRLDTFLEAAKKLKQNSKADKKSTRKKGKIDSRTNEIMQSIEGILDVIKDIKKSVYQVDLLLKSALMALTSTLEWFLSKIFHIYFERLPDSIGIKEKYFSLDDLKKFKTVKDARTYLIESEVEKILRQSLEEWLKIFKERFKLTASYLTENQEKLVEIFQRRNIIVHNGGIVNSIYLSKVSSEFTKKIKRVIV